MSCCGRAKTLTDYKVTYRGGGEEFVTHEEGGLIKVRQLLAKSPKGGTYQPVTRKA